MSGSSFEIKPLPWVGFLIALLMPVAPVMVGCATTHHLPAFQKVTHCEIRTNLNQLRRRIDRPEQLTAVIDFVNARREGWTVPWYGVPVPTRNAYCYADSKLLGHFGAGQNFFGAQQEGGFFSREATRSELDEFLRLIGEQ